MSFSVKMLGLSAYENRGSWSLVTFRGKVFLVNNADHVQCGCCLFEEGRDMGLWSDDDMGVEKLEAGKKFIDALKRAGQSQPVRVSGIDDWHQLSWLGEDARMIMPCAVNGVATEEYKDVKALNEILKVFGYWK